MPRARLRDLGLAVGTLPPGPFNAITDVAGVKVGYSTVIQDTPRIARTGVTAIWPRGPEIWTDFVFAGTFSFNGNGEMTGLPWLAEQGLLGAPLGITNTYQVGIVRDAITAIAVRDGAPQAFHLPVVAETYDGWLSDIQAFTLTQEHAFAAFDSAVGGCPIPEGNVGGGTGMICHEFKGGTGTSSRVVVENGERYTVGALVQANYGARDLLRIDGVPVGREIGLDVVPARGSARSRHRRQKVRLSWCWRPTRRSSRSSASDWPAEPRPGSPGLAVSAPTGAGIFSLRFRLPITSAKTIGSST
jgi:D-aminopeptidase